MIKIYKDKLGVNGDTVVLKKQFKRILTVQNQPGVGPCVWYEVDDNLREIEIIIIAIGTGWELPEQLKFWDYIGTVQDDAGYVWHYYATHFHNADINRDIQNMFGSLFETARLS